MSKGKIKGFMKSLGLEKMVRKRWKLEHFRKKK